MNANEYWAESFPEPEVVHRCKERSAAPSHAHGHALEQVARHDGRWFAVSPLGEYATQIRFCPWCGEALDELAEAPGLYRVLRELEPHLRRTVIVDWLSAAHPRLGGASPLAMLELGELDEVMLAVQDLLEIQGLISDGTGDDA